MDKENLRKLTGESIRKIRNDRNITRDELAEILGLSTSALGLIERGERGFTLANLVKLADKFALSTDSILFREQKPPSSKNQEKRRTINSLVSDFDDEELLLVIQIVKSIRGFKQSRANFFDV